MKSLLMIKTAILFAAIMLFGSPAFVPLLAQEDDKQEVKPQPAVEKKADVAEADKEEVKAARIKRRQKRELGILPIQVIPRVREMAKNGDITETMTSRELAFCYAAEVASSAEYGGAWRQVTEGTYGVDWDGLIAFLERLFELLIRFIPIFL